jgi:hypothetical protein
MTGSNYPPVELVNQALIYQDGSLYWRERPREHFASYRAYKIWNTRFPGEEAGWACFRESENCYRWVICLSGKDIYRSIIVWAMHHGKWPPYDVDHIDNSNPLNDRINNLRLATRSQNNANRGKQSNNTSGFKGVHWDGFTSRWKAEITVNRKNINLGRFDKPEDAHAAYREAAIKHFGEFARFD